MLIKYMLKKFMLIKFMFKKYINKIHVKKVHVNKVHINKIHVKKGKKYKVIYFTEKNYNLILFFYTESPAVIMGKLLL